MENKSQNKTLIENVNITGGIMIFTIHFANTLLKK